MQPAAVLVFPLSQLLSRSSNILRTGKWDQGMMARVPALAVAEGSLGSFQVERPPLGSAKAQPSGWLLELQHCGYF